MSAPLSSNDAFLDAFFSEPNLSWPGRLSSHASAAYLQRFLVALDHPGDTPLILPRTGPGWAAACAYVICQSPSHAARIRPLLGAAVAQNWCEFDGRLAHLQPGDPIDAAVINRFGVNTTYVLRPPTLVAQQGMFAALGQLVSSLVQRPSRDHQVARPVGRLLRDFETSLAAGQAATSLELLQEIERTGGISHENIAFLRIRRLGQLGEDRLIMSDKALRTVVVTDPPRLVREAILAAWYREHARDDRSPVELIQRLRDFPADIALLVDDASVATGGADAWHMVALVALAREDVSLARALLRDQPGDGDSNEDGASDEIRGHLESLAAGDARVSRSDKAESAGPAVEPQTSRQRLQASESGLEADDDTPDDAVSPDVVDARSEPEVESPSPEAGEFEQPLDSWFAWAESLHFANAGALEVEAAEAWPAPGDVDAELAAAIDELPDAATGRLFAGLAAFIDCDDYSRPAWRTAAVLIRRHLLSDSLTPSDLGAIAALLAIFLRAGPDVGAYRGLLNDLIDEDFRGRWAAVSTAPAAMDIADLVVTSPAADRAAQQGFVATALQTLHAQRHRLSETLRVIGDLATGDSELPWDWRIDEDGVQADVDERPLPTSILLYSLEEAVLARAKTAVERLYPGVQINLSSAKVGSVSLREHARRAELIVLATRRASHAATGFIQANASAARIEYADGCGSASMLRAIEQGIRLRPD